MAILSEYLEDTERNNILIQKALRDIDARAFVDCMCGMDDDSAKAIYRNMSKRACEELKKDIDAAKGKAGPEAIRAGMSFYLRKLAMHARLSKADERTPDAFDYGAKSAEKAVGNMLFVAKRARDGDYDELERIMRRSEDRILKEGLRLAIDSADSVEARSRLEKLRDILVADASRRMDLVIDGIESVLQRDTLGATAEKLAIYLGADD